MPKSITPLDAQTFASKEIYRKGEQAFESGLVKDRFQTNFGLKATVRSKGSNHVEMVVDSEQLFGRCSCHAGSSPCEHQVATLLAWLNEPSTFISYQSLRKAIRLKDKTTLIDLLINLCEAFPELSRFFITQTGEDELREIREDVADVFDFPQAEKINPHELLSSFQILFIRAKMLRSEGKWNQARIIFFEILNRMLSLVDSQQLSQPFEENIVADIADDYEEYVMDDPDFEEHQEQIKHQVQELLAHDSADVEGIFLDQVKEKLGLI